MNSEILRVMLTASNSSVKQSCSAFISATSALGATFHRYIYKFIHHEGSTLGYIRYMLKYNTDNYKEDRQSRSN